MRIYEEKDDFINKIISNRIFKQILLFNKNKIKI